MGPFEGKIIFDNINKMSRSWDPTVAQQDVVRCGTSAIVIKLEDVTPGALRLEPLLKAFSEKRRSTLTVQELKQDIDWKHLQGVSIGLILRILVKHVPSLSTHRAAVEQLFIETYNKHRLPLRKTEVHSVRCSGIDESTTVGAHEAVKDVVQHQLGLTPERLNKFLLVIGGDQLSIDRVRKSKRILEKGEDNAECARYMVPEIQGWHKKYNYAKGIVRANWHLGIGRGIYGLHHDCSLLGRKFNPTKCDFYPMHKLLEVRFEALTLEAVRCAILFTCAPQRK